MTIMAGWRQAVQIARAALDGVAIDNSANETAFKEGTTITNTHTIIATFTTTTTAYTTTNTTVTTTNTTITITTTNTTTTTRSP